MRSFRGLPNVKIFSRLGFILLILLGLGPVFVTAAAQGNEAKSLAIVAPALNVRSGPGVSYPAFDILVQGERVAVIGYDENSDWWQVELADGKSGWVSGGPAYVAVGTGAAELQAGAVNQNTQYTVRNSPSTSNSTVVFQASSGGPIYAVDPGGTNLRYLTSGIDPVLSPNGQWVAFSRWETSQDGALGSLWLINVDGSGERVIHENLFNPRTPVWSPDGSQIVLSMQHGGRTQYVRKCSDSRPPVGAIDIDIRRDADGDREICFTLLPDPHWSLRQVDVASGAHEDLTGDKYSLSPAWDPNYTPHLVYDGESGLVNLDLDQNRTWALTGDVNDHSPVFSPDGGKIALSYRQDDHWEIHVMNVDGSNRRRLTQTSYLDLVRQQLRGEQPHSYNNAAPAWSPDGSQIAFLTDRTGAWEIWIMNADGSNQQPLITAEMLAGIPLQYNGMDERSLSWR